MPHYIRHESMKIPADRKVATEADGDKMFAWCGLDWSKINFQSCSEHLDYLLQRQLLWLSRVWSGEGVLAFNIVKQAFKKWSVLPCAKSWDDA